MMIDDARTGTDYGVVTLEKPQRCLRGKKALKKTIILASSTFDNKRGAMYGRLGDCSQLSF